MSQQLTEDFVIELMKLCLKDKNVFQVASSHMKYQYFPDQHHKEVWQTMVTYLDATNKIPTIGILTQVHERDIDVLGVIAKIKKANMPDINHVFEQIEEFIKTSIFLQAYDEIGDLYNDNKKQVAFEKMEKFADAINTFSIKQSYYDKIFSQYKERHLDRKLSKERGEFSDKIKIPTGIDELDYLMRGGVDIGDTFLILAQSGIGKTKLLRYIGVSAARRGYKVLHIQAEGSRQEALDGYDSTWSGVKLTLMEYGDIEEGTLLKMEEASRNIKSNGGEIFVEAYEKFESASLQDIRNAVIEIERNEGKINVIILDYLELVDPGDGKRYKVSEERQRREALGNGLKNIAVEFKVAIFTATQASTVAPHILNDPDFVQTRYDISEFKGAIKPFSYFITLNQTSDEYQSNYMRIYVDKVRKYKGGQIIPIYQRYENERFYDRKKTKAEIGKGQN